jgi:putative transcriptional regulator
MARKSETNNELFEELKASLNDAIEHAQGKRKELRTTTLPRPPKELSPKEIVKMRNQLNVSQAVFARYLNISTKTVQSWEQGVGKPNGASLKLLSIAKKNPRLLLET